MKDLLQAAAKLPAPELDAFIRALALLRAEKHPAVGRSPASAMDEAAILVEDKPALLIGVPAFGGFRLRIRHSGFGWLAFQIDDTVAADLAGFIHRTLEKDRNDLIREKIGRPH